MNEVRYWEICPHCQSTHGFMVIQNQIELMWTLPNDSNDQLVELWQCGECSKYIKVYSRIEKIQKLTEEDGRREFELPKCRWCNTHLGPADNGYCSKECKAAAESSKQFSEPPATGA